MNRDNASLQDIADAAQQILEASEQLDKSSLANNDIYQSAILFKIVIMGEATKRLSPEFRAQHSEIPWKELAGMRDIVVHQYDRVNIDTLWNAIQIDVPQLLVQLEPLLLEAAHDNPHKLEDAELRPEPGSREDVLDAARYITNQVGESDGSGQRYYETDTFKIETEANDVTVWDSQGDKMIEISHQSGEDIYQPSSELISHLTAVANELEQQDFERETEQDEQLEVDEGFGIDDD